MSIKRYVNTYIYAHTYFFCVKLTVTFYDKYFAFTPSQSSENIFTSCGTSDEIKNKQNKLHFMDENYGFRF